ncbi:MAG: acetyltransferase, partial [Planctomycetaceae bacterium]|nr:acetyltransferase [Planctomycetaceae bacterium]
KVMERAQQAGCLFPVLSHPTSIISPSAQLGTGTVLCAGSIVGTGAVLGTGCLLNTGSSVDHDCRLAEFVHVCPGAHLAGDVKVGAESWIGIGTAVIEGRTIGARSIIGAGSVVTRDLPDDVVAYGNPARIQKSRVN